MKTFAAATVLAAASALTTHQDIELISGILFAITKYDHLDTLHSCMRNADIFSMEIIHAIGLIREHDERSTIAGYRLVTSAMSQFPTFLDGCEQSGADLKGLEDFFLRFIHPINLFKRVCYNIVHGPLGLAKNLGQAKQNLKQEDYFDFGMEVGQIVVALTEPIPDKIEDFLQ